MKKNLLLLIGALISTILLLIIIITTNSKKRAVEIINTEKGSVTINNEEKIAENGSIYGTSMASPRDDIDSESPNEVILSNTDFFQSTSLPSSAWVTFPYFFAEYLKQHVSGTQWHVTAVSNSFEDDMNFPYFYCAIDELDNLEVKCTYSVAEDVYFFRCKSLDDKSYNLTTDNDDIELKED